MDSPSLSGYSIRRWYCAWARSLLAELSLPPFATINSRPFLMSFTVQTQRSIIIDHCQCAGKCRPIRSSSPIYSAASLFPMNPDCGTRTFMPRLSRPDRTKRLATINGSHFGHDRGQSGARCLQCEQGVTSCKCASCMFSPSFASNVVMISPPNGAARVVEDH